MKKPTMKNALYDIAEGINGVIDNWDYWNDQQKKSQLWVLQGIACSAIPKKLTIKKQVLRAVKTLALLIGLLCVSGPAMAFDRSMNPDRVPSFGLDLWKGQVAGLDRKLVETNGGTVGGLFDYRHPVSNSLTLRAFAESEGVNNNLRYTDGYRVGIGLRVFLQD